MRADRLYQRLSASQRAGILAASASVPMSLVPLLRPRSAVDQGLITGLSAAMDYALTTVAHDLVLAASHGVLRLAGVRIDTRSTARTTLAVDLVAVAASAAVHAALARREDEPTARAVVRTTALRVGAASVAGLVPGLLDAVPGRDRPIRAALRTVPGVVAVGAGVAAGAQLLRVERLRTAGVDIRHDDPAPMVRSLGIGAITASGAVAFASLERHIARAADAAIDRVSGAPGHGPVVSHLLSVAGIGAGLYAVGARLSRRAERAVSGPDGTLSDPPRSPFVSGCSDSVVTWGPLTRQVRRHLVSATPAARIASVMGEPALEPIRLYVGLTSAPTVAERIELALAELDRTRALDRSLLVLCSPTGSGYVSYGASSTWEYLSRGDCASLTLQYSVRPSILSLGRVDDGREQNRAMWTAVAGLLARRDPADRPRVVVFGESLGAFTGQDAFLGTGTRGLRQRLVERALWLGTPHLSGWPQEVRDVARPDVEPGLVLTVACAEDLDRLDPGTAARARYILLSHHDDGVTLFSPDLLLRRPSWLAEQRTAAVPPQAGWSTPITFLQIAIDVKNAGAMAPGRFEASGHDYRGDIARAVRFAFDLPCSDDQLAAVERALRQEELDRVATWRPGSHSLPPPPDMLTGT